MFLESPLRRFVEFVSSDVPARFRGTLAETASGRAAPLHRLNNPGNARYGRPSLIHLTHSETSLTYSTTLFLFSERVNAVIRISESSPGDPWRTFQMNDCAVGNVRKDKFLIEFRRPTACAAALRSGAHLAVRVGPSGTH